MTDLCYALLWWGCEVFNFALCHEEIHGMLGRTHTLFISRAAHIFPKMYEPPQNSGHVLRTQKWSAPQCKIESPGRDLASGICPSLVYLIPQTAKLFGWRNSRPACIPKYAPALWMFVTRGGTFVMSKIWLTLHTSLQTFRTLNLAPTQMLTSAVLCEDLSVHVLYRCTVDSKYEMTIWYWCCSIKG